MAGRRRYPFPSNKNAPTRRPGLIPILKKPWFDTLATAVHMLPMQERTISEEKGEGGVKGTRFQTPSKDARELKHCTF